MGKFFLVSCSIVAIITCIALSIRHLCSGQRRDPAYSELRSPPRALTGNLGLPIVGHTRLFRKHGHRIGHFFPSHWNEWKCIKCDGVSWSRKLASTFSLFIYGYWNIVIRNQEVAQHLFESGKVELGLQFGWTTPVDILGKEFMAIQQNGVFPREWLHSLHCSFSKRNIMSYAQRIGMVALLFVTDLHCSNLEETCHDTSTKTRSCGIIDGQISIKKTRQITFSHLQYYTLKLMEGPIADLCPDKSTKNSIASEKAVRWITRAKRGLMSPKILPNFHEVTQIWRLTRYGTALNARNHFINDMVLEHFSDGKVNKATMRIKCTDALHSIFSLVSLFQILLHLFSLSWYIYMLVHLPGYDIFNIFCGLKVKTEQRREINRTESKPKAAFITVDNILDGEVSSQ